MFQMKARQLEAFARDEEMAFEARVAERLRAHFEALAGQSDEDLRAFVRLGRERAAAYGMRAPYHVSLYVGAMAELGADFDRSGAFPWATEILEHPDVDPTTKITVLYARIEDDRRASGAP
jgi:hypothetical protein